MKKLLSSVLILTLSFNFIGTNCLATDEPTTSKVSEKLKQINDALARIKNKLKGTLLEVNNTAANDEMANTEANDDSKANESSTDSAEVETKKDESKSVKKTFREKQIEKLNKEIQKLENTSDKKYFWKNFFLKTIKFVIPTAAIWGIGNWLWNWFASTIDLFLKENYEKGYDKGLREFKNQTKSIIGSVLTNLHPDNFKKPKSYEDVRELYCHATNFFNNYLK